MKYWFLFLAWGFLAFPVWSQSPEPTEKDILKKLREGPEETVWPPYSVEESMAGSKLAPMVRVFIRGKGPFLFLLDTGSDITLIRESLVQETGLPARVTDSELRVTLVDEMRLGDIRFRNFMAGIRSWEGPVDGILGYPLFMKARLTIDLPRMRYTLEPSGEESSSENTLRMNRVTEGVPSFPVRLGNRQADIIVSTGLSEYIRVPESGLEYFNLKLPPVPAVSTNSFSVDEEVTMARVTDNLVLGEHIVMEPILTIGHTGEYRIGCGLLSYFRVVLDPENNQISFLRNSDIPIEIPPVRQLGFVPRRDERGWMVEKLLPWFSELDLNIRPGDRIQRVESRDAVMLTANNWVELERLNNYLTLVLERDGKEIMLDVPVRIILP
ncbi:MAG: retropepsin-like aspartic protease [Bacteroidales bacterium]